MDLSIISLLFLVACIAIGFLLKRNIGLIAIAMALILGRLGGIADSDIISGFNSNLFMVLLGVSYLFAIARSNGTLEAVARKTIALAGKHINLIPIIMVIAGALLSMAGPGTIPVLALMVMLSTALAKELGIDPLSFTVCCFMGAAGGGMSPIAPTGIVALELAAEEGYTGISIPYMFTVLLAFLLFAIIYYFATGLFKAKAQTVPLAMKEVPPLTRQQWITIGGIVVMILLVLFLGINVGLASFLIAAILNLMGMCEERQILKEINWGTLIMICGTGVLMNVIIQLGGIDKLSAALASIMSPYSAPSLMALSSGTMGFFASTSGVVIPTLVPTVPGIIETLGGGVTPLSLISALSIGSQIAGISPASTGGALALAAFVTMYNPNAEEKNRYFLRLFITAIIGVLFMSALGLTGFYSLLQ